MKENVIMRKSFAFSVRIMNLQKYLSQKKGEYVVSRQICKSGTSIGANIAEAQRAQSTADFCIENENRAERGQRDAILASLALRNEVSVGSGIS